MQNTQKDWFANAKVGCSQCNKTIALDDANCADHPTHGPHFVCDECLERLDCDIDIIVPRDFPPDADAAADESSNII